MPFDLSDVDPLRRRETLRRLQAIAAYLEIPKPTRRDLDAIAASLDLSPTRFYRLVRAWRETGSAEAVSTRSGRPLEPRPGREGGLPINVRSTAEEALAGLSADASYRDAHRAVVSLCRSRNLVPPSPQMTGYLRLSLRQRGIGHTADATIVIGRAFAALPVDQDGMLRMPELALAARLGDGALLAASLDPVRLPRFLLPPSTPRVIVDEDLAGAVGNGCDISVGIETRFNASRRLARAIGRGIRNIPFVFQANGARHPERLLKAAADEVLTPSEADAAIVEAMSRHNEARGWPPPAFLGANGV